LDQYDGTFQREDRGQVTVPNAYNVLLVSPAFPRNTFWNIKVTCEIAGARHSAIPLGLITVAAMLPAHWNCRLIDRNVRDVTDADFAWADLVMTGGMNVQRADCRKVIDAARRAARPVVVGGPDVSSQPECYAEADFRVVGEAESVIDDFIAAWNAGQRQGLFVAEKFKANITTTPVPRYDLLRREDYLYFSLQFSRGCPFKCEFCDIIELYGRVPRVKTAAQFLGELEALHRQGYRGHLDFVDDNFIGNKKAVKLLLPALADWQRRHGYPFWFSTEASINLADDDELLTLMRAANFGIVFVGIESPDSATLVSMQKKQNANRDLARSVHKIYAAGMLVIAGFIIGFDTEPSSIAEPMIGCVEATAIPICMMGLLVALPNTQLWRRLEHEQRLFPATWLDEAARDHGGDQCTLGLNFLTLRPRRDVLDDYRRSIDSVYAPSSYFRRAYHVAETLHQWPPHAPECSEAPSSIRPFGLGLADWRQLLRLTRRAAWAGPVTLFHVVAALIWAVRNRPAALFAVATFAAFYVHLGPFARQVSRAATRQIDDIDSGRWRAPRTETSHSRPAATGMSIAERSVAR
jgi:radical SAM superfamily enzyme YgiQ (UPF0313 family)